jgi:hexosaminidase
MDNTDLSIRPVIAFLHLSKNYSQKSFPVQCFHLGGDKVDFNCRQSNPNIKKFMTDKQITNYTKLEDYYMQQIFNIGNHLNRSCVVW